MDIAFRVNLYRAPVNTEWAESAGNADAVQSGLPVCLRQWGYHHRGCAEDPGDKGPACADYTEGNGRPASVDPKRRLPQH